MRVAGSLRVRISVEPSREVRSSLGIGSAFEVGIRKLAKPEIFNRLCVEPYVTRAHHSHRMFPRQFL